VSALSDCMAVLRVWGETPGKVERWNPHSHKREDLWGFVDLISVGEFTIRFIQVFDERHGSRRNQHLDKILTGPMRHVVEQLLKNYASVELWGLRKSTRKGKFFHRSVLKLTLEGDIRVIEDDINMRGRTL